MKVVVLQSFVGKGFISYHVQSKNIIIDNQLLITKCMKSVKNWCNKNGYEYILNTKDLGWNYIKFQMKKEGFVSNEDGEMDLAVQRHKLMLDIKADYIPETDTMTIEPTSDFRDFVMTILHECHHAMMAQRMGIEKFVKRYNQAGTMAAHGGLDPHDNNKWEKKAEKYAEQNIDRWMKKLKKA